MDAKEKEYNEKIVSLRNEKAKFKEANTALQGAKDELQSLYDDRVKELIQKNDAIQAMEHNQQQKQEENKRLTDQINQLEAKHTEAIAKEEEMKRAAVIKMNQLEEKHTAATCVKEEKIVSLENTHADEMAKLKEANTALQGEKGELQSLYDAMVDELAQKDDAIQAMEHNQQQKQEEIKRLTDQINQLEKLNEAMHMK
eukprot:469706_1